MRIKAVGLPDASDYVVKEVHVNSTTVIFDVRPSTEPAKDNSGTPMYVTLWVEPEERERLRRLLESKAPKDPAPKFIDGRTEKP